MWKHLNVQRHVGRLKNVRVIYLMPLEWNRPILHFLQLRTAMFGMMQSTKCFSMAAVQICVFSLLWIYTKQITACTDKSKMGVNLALSLGSIQLHRLFFLRVKAGPQGGPRYKGCFTTLGHNCRRWFPRSLWWKKSSYKHVSGFGRLRSYAHFLIPVHALVWTASYSWRGH